MNTGVDIEGLRFLICAEPYGSKVTAEQTSGRLREFSDNSFTLYIHLIDKGFNSIVKSVERILPVFKRKCVKIMKVEL